MEASKLTADSIFDDPRSRESEELAFKAERCRNPDEAMQLFARAAVLEEAVVAEIPLSSPRVRRVLAISAMALWLKASEYRRASDLAVGYVAAGLVTQGDLDELVDAYMATLLTEEETP